MSFTKVCSSMLKKRSTERAEAEDQYRSLVGAAASDQNVSASEIEETLSRCGRTLEQLQADVAAEQERRRNIGVAGRRDELLGELAELTKLETAEHEAYAAEFRDVQERHQAAGAAFQARRAIITAELDRCRAAERSLTSASPRLAEIRLEVGQLLQEERRCVMPYGGLRRRVPLGSQAADQLVRIDERRERLAREAEEIERELLSAN